MKKRADGRYQKAVSIDGVKHIFYGKTIAEIKKKVMSYKEKEKNGRLFSEVAEEWYDEHVQTLSPNTVHGYLCAKNEAVQYFGKLYINEVTSNQVQKYLMHYVRKKYAHKTIMTKLMILHQVFDYAMLNGEVSANPTLPVTLPRNLPRTSRASLTPEQIDIVKKSSNLLAMAALYTGCRRGELLALNSKDIDFDTGKISIT